MVYAKDPDQRRNTAKSCGGYSLVELLVSMLVTSIIMGAAVAAFTGALRGREFQAARTDAIVSAQAAINVMTREIGNSGYGLINNGLVLADSNGSRIHFRTNVDNSDLLTNDVNEDVTFYCDGCDVDGGSIVRHDAVSGVRSGIINKISSVQFQYWNYDEITHAVTGPFNTPTLNTGRVTITLTVVLSNVGGSTGTDVSNVTVSSDVTLRNSPYMLTRY
jgi:prepilin-type N-terminal cleavage/methylation domain-containing protein